MKEKIAAILILGFLIGIHKGQIGIWKNQDPQVWRIIPCPVWVLSQSQQDMLSKGMSINSIEDLENILTTFFP